jgi:hypothetical protein
MISTMYCATCVQVTARMPPSIEQTRMPSRPTKTATTEVHAEEARAMMPVAEDLRHHIGEGAGKQHDDAEGAPRLPPYRADRKSGTVIGAELAQERRDRIATST